MIKKIGLASSLLLCAMNATADFSPAPYVGGGIGIVTNTDKLFGVFRGLPLRVFAGYGGIVNTRLYFAGELGATIVTGDLANNSYGLETNTNYMLSVLPGFMLNDNTLGYARLGVLKTWFESPKEGSYGTRLGFGLETMVTPNITVRGEYDLTVYQNIHRAGMARSPRSDGGSLDLIYRFV